MRNLKSRVDDLEKAMITHLEESGEIRADIKWLKKILWLVVASPIVTEGVRHLWK